MDAAATEPAGAAAARPDRAPLEPLARRSSRRLLRSWRWEWGVAGIALAAAVAALWITLRASFLSYPAWLAVQKADFIIGPVGVGLYWRHRRPDNRLGLLLIALGLVGVVYILESSTVPALFGVGLQAEAPIYVMTSLVILAFPSGRLDGRAERLLITLVAVTLLLPAPLLALASPHLGPYFSISGCRASCPPNGLAIWSVPSWMPQLLDVQGVMLVVIPVATACLIVWRFLTGTPPRRRATAIGGPIALVFVLTQAIYRAIFLVTPNGLTETGKPVQDAIQWIFAGARSLLWYGFLFALIAAELYAGGVLRRLVRNSLLHPSLRDLEQMLREPLGDPSLRLGFWHPSTLAWTAADGTALVPPGAGQALTEVKQDGHPAAAIVHDEQLAEDPELLQAAGAVALLALENANLDTAWKKSLRELADSRARISQASDRERRKLGRDLHDGAQQRLVHAIVTLKLAQSAFNEGDGTAERLVGEGLQQTERGMAELRELAHGILPAALTHGGLRAGVDAFVERVDLPVEVNLPSARLPAEIEASAYFMIAEALTNVMKHSGASHARVTATVDDNVLKVDIRDDGAGGADPTGHGLVGMSDRVAAFGGQLTIDSPADRGTHVQARFPLSEAGALQPGLEVGRKPSGDARDPPRSISG